MRIHGSSARFFNDRLPAGSDRPEQATVILMSQFCHRSFVRLREDWLERPVDIGLQPKRRQV
jgi:hypothetical protein